MTELPKPRTNWNRESPGRPQDFKRGEAPADLAAEPLLGGADGVAAAEIRRAQWARPHFLHTDRTTVEFPYGAVADPQCPLCHGMTTDCLVGGVDWRLCPNAM